MTLEDIEKSSPNGLHDSKLRRVTIDYRLRTLEAEVEVWIGDTGETAEGGETYKHGRIEISGLIFMIMESPDPKYPFLNSAQLTIDGCDQQQNLDPTFLKSLPKKSFVRSLWVGEWNAFIHVAGTNAELSWVDNHSTFARAKS